MRVFRALHCVDGDLVEDSPLPDKSEFQLRDIANVLASLHAAADETGPAWTLEFNLGFGSKTQCIRMPFEPFLTAAEYEKSVAIPVCLAELEAVKGGPAKRHSPIDEQPRWLWLFRDGIYVTDRMPRASEIEHVILQVKSLHFQRDETFKRLREQVANFEAVENNLRGGVIRRPLPDDVKLLVWTRDGGSCVKCSTQSGLHFDHIISLARGGSDEAENIQLLCRTCNLAKSDRIV